MFKPPLVLQIFETNTEQSVPLTRRNPELNLVGIRT